MARAAAKGGKRPSQNARRRQQQQRSAAASTGRRKLSGTEQNLFFSRIRRQAKWAYVILAVLFAITFAALGVGSGQGGLDQLFNVFSGGGGTSISKLENKTKDHPRDATAWKQLAIAYAGKQRNEDAVAAMTQYTQLRPKDATGWTQLGQFQSTAAGANANLYGIAQGQANAWQTAADNPLAPTTGKLAGVTASDPIQQGVQTQISQAQSLASSLQTTAKSEYVQALQSLDHAARLQPKDPSGWNNVVLQAITAMRSIGTDPSLAKPALAAYDRLKKLDPATAAQYKQFVPTLKQLSGIKGG